MRKRLRKSLRLNEFQELGFHVVTRLDPDMARDDWNRFIDDFLEQAIEANGLAFGGGGQPGSWSGFVCLDHPRGSASEEHRQAVRSWLEGHEGVRGVEVGELVDAWYGPFEWTRPCPWDRGRQERRRQ